MPSRTFIYKDQTKVRGFKAYKDRVTSVMFGNTEGFLLKVCPYLQNQEPLPVHWMHNNKGWITNQLTSDWFHECFILQVKLYFTENGLVLNVHFLMNNVEGHVHDLSYDGVQIEFLPPNTTSLIEPMNQGVIRAFKALYTRNTLQHLIEGMDLEENFSLKQYWRHHTIATCLKNIQTTLKDMKVKTMKFSWENFWPKIVHDYSGLTPADISHSAVDKAVRLTRRQRREGFADMTCDDVDELLEACSDSLTNDDLVMIESANGEEQKKQQPVVFGG